MKIKIKHDENIYMNYIHSRNPNLLYRDYSSTNDLLKVFKKELPEKIDIDNNFYKMDISSKGTTIAYYKIASSPNAMPDPYVMAEPYAQKCANDDIIIEFFIGLNRFQYFILIELV